MDRRVNYVAPPRGNNASSSKEGGFVKEMVTYMVLDDLEIQPMSSISTIAVLNKFHVKDVGSLEEKVVDLGADELMKLLKASFQSKTVLTDVFLGKKEAN